MTRPSTEQQSTEQQPWRRDLVVAAGSVLAGALLQLLLPDARLGVQPGAPPEPGWLGLAPLFVAGLGQILRRTYPVLALLIGVAALVAGPVVVGWVGLPVAIVFIDLLICGVLYSSALASGAVVGAAVLAVAVATGLQLADGGGRAALRTAVEIGLALWLPVGWGLEVRWHRGRAELHRQRAEQAQRLAVLESSTAVAAERARMARDLHDVIAGQLSAIAIQSTAALNLPDADPATLRRVLGAVRRDSVASLAEMRTMIGLLRADGSADDESRIAPAGLDELDTLLVPARAAGLTVTVDDRRRDGQPLAAAVDLAAFRIVQESLTNAMKHAPGGAVRLRLAHENGQLVIRVENNLGDGAPGGGTGTGLLGLEERARAVGGQFSAGVRGREWVVRAVLPIAATERDVAAPARPVAPPEHGSPVPADAAPTHSGNRA